MAEAERRSRLRSSFNHSCGYCGVREDECGSELEEDHYQPRCHGGSSAFGNLVYCCPMCNRLKGDFWNPDPTSTRRVLHPHRDDVPIHIGEGPGGRLMPLTETGAFHIRRLRLNRPQLVALRLRRQRRSALERQNTHLAECVDHLAREQEALMALLMAALDGDEDAVARLRDALRRG